MVVFWKYQRPYTVLLMASRTATLVNVKEPSAFPSIKHRGNSRGHWNLALRIRDKWLVKMFNAFPERCTHIACWVAAALAAIVLLNQDAS